MENRLVLHKVINVINGKEHNINREFNVKNINLFLNKFILNNPESIFVLYLTHDNTNYNFLCVYDIDTGKPKFYNMDKTDVLLFETILKPMPINKKIDRIIKNANIILQNSNFNLTSEELNEFKDKLIKINEDKETNAEITNKINQNIKNKVIEDLTKSYITEQKGGIILAIIENALDAMPVPYFGMLFTGVLEVIDLILMGMSAIPVVGIPFDILSGVFALLRGQFTMLIPILFGFVPVVGDAGSTIMKFIAKVMRIAGKINKYKKKFDKVASRVGTAVDVAQAGHNMLQTQMPQMGFPQMPTQMPQMGYPQMPTQMPTQMPQMGFPQMPTQMPTQMPQMGFPQMPPKTKKLPIRRKR